MNNWLMLIMSFCRYTNNKRACASHNIKIWLLRLMKMHAVHPRMIIRVSRAQQLQKLHNLSRIWRWCVQLWLLMRRTSFKTKMNLICCVKRNRNCKSVLSYWKIRSNRYRSFSVVWEVFAKVHNHVWMVFWRMMLG